MKINQIESINKIMIVINQKINAIKDANEKKKVVHDYVDKIVKKQDEYLCFEFAKEYGAFINIDDLYKLGDVILKSRNPYLCIFFPKCFRLKNFDKFVEVIKNSAPFYILNFLRAFPNFDANYFSKEILEKGNAEQNIDFVYEFVVKDVIPHSKKIADIGTPEQNFNYIIGIDTIFSKYPYEAISANVNKIIESGDAMLNFNYVMIFKPTKNLEKHAKVIADSDDLFLNFLACENWPDQDPLELAMFTRVIHNHTIQELENRLIFRLKMLDRKDRKLTIQKYFDLDNKNKEDEEDIEKYQ